MSLGVRDLRDLALPAGWDGAFLERQRLQDGTTYEAVIAQLVGALAAFNASLGAHPWLPLLTFQTTQNTVRYRTDGNTGRWRDHTEYTPPDAYRAETTGHMIERKKKDDALGWTWDYLNEAILEDVNADIADFLYGGLEMYEVGALIRFFKLEEVTVGDSGISPPYCDGGGGTLAFTPPPYGGATFAAAHIHYLRYSDTEYGAAAAAMAAHLKEHGHMPTWELWISDADKAAWATVADATNRVYFRQVQRTDVQYAVDLSMAGAGVNEETYIGVIETPSGTARVRAMTRIPTGYAGMFKVYGGNSQQNPLRWLYNTKFGAGLVPISGDKLGWPVQKIMGYAEWGFGVGRDRTAAVFLKIAASGDYTTPTIS